MQGTKILSALESGVKILYNTRRCGNTTRIIDESIQILFRDGAVVVDDYRTEGNVSMDQKKHLANRIKERYLLEHKGFHTSIEVTQIAGEVCVILHNH
jgi:predicted O-methyltransferase YrrM